MHKSYSKGIINPGGETEEHCSVARPSEFIQASCDAAKGAADEALNEVEGRLIADLESL